MDYRPGLVLGENPHFTDGLRPLVKSLFSPRPPWVAQKILQFLPLRPPLGRTTKTCFVLGRMGTSAHNAGAPTPPPTAT